ncbi:cytochrome c oxidase subunit 5b-2, mitochondrial [Musa acuminata AAA Group]|uniref:cytochrome c oxidase subunit 5b-2, mitochondrial n=1 Tax=Musa acuminata AAA Group TaxID=214697 RepID=UPI0031D464A3
MWRRVCVASCRPALRKPHASAAALALAPVLSSSPSRNTPRLSFSSSASGDGSLKKRVVVMPIVMELEGKKRFDMDAAIGPFGTKEAPAVIEAYYDKRIVGCTGGDGEDKHDLVWFWLEKGKPHECRVCSQCYVLEVIGEGGPPDDEVDLEVDGEGGLHVVDHEVDDEGGLH